MKPHFRTGFRRLAVFCGLLAAVAWSIFVFDGCILSRNPLALWQFGVVLLVTTPIVGASAWAFVLLLGWVCDGFSAD